MPESAEETYARAVALVGEHGRLPTPPVEEWDVFPWDGDVSTKVLRPPVAEEPPRAGAPGGEPCSRCEHPTQNAIWADENWLVTSKPEPGGLPLPTAGRWPAGSPRTAVRRWSDACVRSTHVGREDQRPPGAGRGRG